MPYPTKIATCCHCGARAALKLDQTRHELACASCGAPLHNLKAVPLRKAPTPAVTHQKAPQPRPVPVPKKVVKERKRPKRRKGWFAERFKDLAEDLFDVVEDIFD